MKGTTGRWDAMRAGRLRCRLGLLKITRVLLYGAGSKVLLAIALFAAGMRVGAELAGDPVVVVSPSVQAVHPVAGEAVAEAAPAPPPEEAQPQTPGDGLLAAASTDPCRPGGRADDAPLEQTTSLVDLNRAGVDELDGLPGIGPVLARRIVEFRQQHGPFAMVEDLLEVPGIGPKTLERLRALVRVSGP